MSQSLAKNLIHLTFTVKDHRPLLREEEREQFHAYALGILRNCESPSLIMNSVRDHVHILFQLSKNWALSQVVKELKGSSSKWLKEQDVWYRDFHWQGGYAAFSVSESQVERVSNYIRNQQEHHQKLNFKDELRLLLERHGIQFDERYLWDYHRRTIGGVPSGRSLFSFSTPGRRFACPGLANCVLAGRLSGRHVTTNYHLLVEFNFTLRVSRGYSARIRPVTRQPTHKFWRFFR